MSFERVAGVGSPGSFVPGVPTVEIWPIPSGDRLRIRIDRNDPPAADPAVLAEWSRMLASNPRLYNGPILAIVSVDLHAAEIHCRRDSYQRLIVQPRIRTGVQQLAVTGVLVSRDDRGREHVLLGRRDDQTRMYGGMWELGPAGGVDPTHPRVDELSAMDVLTQLAEEIEDEIGQPMPVDSGSASIVALIRDHDANSQNLVVRTTVGPLAPLLTDRTGNWEYTETRWIAADELAAFDAAEADRIIPPSRALFRVMGWVR